MRQEQMLMPIKAASGRSRPRKNGIRACVSCWKKKVQCDNRFPCGRCYQLCLECRLPTGDEKKEEERRQADDSPASVLLELAFSRNDPRGLAEEYLRAFYVLHEEGVLDRQLVLGVLRTYKTNSLMVGSDVTWGIAGEIAKALSLAPTDLELPEALCMEKPGQIR